MSSGETAAYVQTALVASSACHASSGQAEHQLTNQLASQPASLACSERMGMMSTRRMTTDRRRGRPSPSSSTVT